MKMNRILAVLLVVLMAVSCVVPAFADGEPAAEKTNVFLDAYCIWARNIYQRQDTQFWNLSDGEIAPGPTHIAGSLTASVQNTSWRYDANGVRNTNGDYLWQIAYQLKKEATFESVSVWFADLQTLGVGVSNIFPWLLYDFDLLVSDDGQNWTVAYSAKGLHTDSTADAKYIHHDATEARVATWEYADSFAPVTAKYVMIASATMPNGTTSGTNWIDFSEIELFGTFTEDAEELVINNATYKATPIAVKSLSLKDTSGPSDLVNGMHAYGNHAKGNFGAQITNPAAGDQRYNASGVMGYKSTNSQIENPDDQYLYLWYVAYELRDTFALDHFTLYFCDLGVNWLFKDFGIMVSETGEEGTWKTAYSGSNLWEGSTATAYTYHQAEDAEHVNYYQIDASFDKVYNAKYVAIGFSTLIGSSGYIRVSELDIFSVNKTELNQAIADATDFYNEVKDELPELAATLKEAIDAAQAVADNKEATQEEVDNATKNMKAALQKAENDKEPASNQAAFAKAKQEIIDGLNEFLTVDSSPSFAEKIADLQKKIEALEYDDTMDLLSNIMAIMQVIAEEMPELIDQLKADGKVQGEFPFGDVVGVPALTPWDVPWATEEATFVGSPWLAYYIDQTQTVDYDAPFVDYFYPVFHP